MDNADVAAYLKANLRVEVEFDRDFNSVDVKLLLEGDVISADHATIPLPEEK